MWVRYMGHESRDGKDGNDDDQVDLLCGCDTWDMRAEMERTAMTMIRSTCGVSLIFKCQSLGMLLSNNNYSKWQSTLG